VLWARSGGTLDVLVFILKKGEPLNYLNSLEPKRQILTVNRHDRSGYRQKQLALLSVLCQGRDSQTTTSEGQNDG
jgi:hypothetical protein